VMWKMMRRGMALWACFLFLHVAPLAAQRAVVRLGGGIASAYRHDAHNVGALKLGVGGQLDMNDRITLETGLYYYAKGWKEDDKEVFAYDEAGNKVYDDDGKEVTGWMNVSTNANYVELPVLAHFRITGDRERGLYVTAGPYVAYGVGGKTKTSGDTEQQGAARLFYTKNTFGQDGMKRFDAGLSAGLGYRFTDNIDASCMAEFGLLNVNSNKDKLFAVVVTLGYRF